MNKQIRKLKLINKVNWSQLKLSQEIKKMIMVPECIKFGFKMHGEKKNEKKNGEYTITRLELSLKNFIRRNKRKKKL